MAKKKLSRSVELVHEAMRLAIQVEPALIQLTTTVANLADSLGVGGKVLRANAAQRQLVAELLELLEVVESPITVANLADSLGVGGKVLRANAAQKQLVAELLELLEMVESPMERKRTLEWRRAQFRAVEKRLGR